MELKVLLVDDEINIVRNLQKIIPWHKYDFTKVDTASNGAKALEYVLNYDTDLILCDIRMPQMDGLSFLEKLKDHGKKCTVLMLTGYQDFDYVRSALKNGARDYILKPINYEELERIIAKHATEIKNRKLEQIKERNKWNKAMIVAYEKFLYDVLLDYTTVSSRQFLFDEENKLDELQYTLLLIDLDDYSQISRGWNEKERKLINFAVRNVLLDALMSHSLAYAVLQTREGEWCVLIQHQKNSGYDLEMVHMWSRKMLNAVSENVKLTVSVGIYPVHVPIDKLADAYKQLQRTVHLSPQNHQIIVLEEEVSQPNELKYSMWGLVEEIVSSIKKRDRDKMEQAFQELNNTLREISGQSLQRAEQFLHFMILHLLREMHEINVLTSEDEKSVWTMLERSISIKSLLDIIHKLLNDSFNSSTNRKPSDMLMVSAKDYIDKNLANDLGVEEISDYLGISYSYFSMLFKQTFGETFLEYLTKQRIELAKSMLLASDKSVAQIGKLVGYSERRYFTRVFYKFTGSTPSEYREKNADPKSILPDLSS
ncbi:response regulator [Paenibacillus albiflavus]|uniref:Response regulator n=1 Tax=Paenibacillus albiflavus TaxID=2545760 RepID=A0A4R4EG26_9BACL|nr:response regulator [Paenibacillus albiflavus]TCZ77191.1 response regulator [Paenibacillus albiflavus]